MSRPWVIGLTGGIGSGKSTAAAHFINLGVPVIDADQITRALCALGQPALTEIVAAFGSTILTPQGELDRPRMRTLIFKDATAKAQLEAILHPKVRIEMIRQINTLNNNCVILVIPLLLESEMTDLVDRILVIDCTEETQIQRIMSRDGLSREQAEKHLSTQISRAARCSAADDIIINETDRTSVYRQVEALHHVYQKKVV